jgi:hypothetical protein
MRKITLFVAAIILVISSQMTVQALEMSTHIQLPDMPFCLRLCPTRSRGTGILSVGKKRRIGD